VVTLEAGRLPAAHDVEATAIGCALAYPETLDDFVKLNEYYFDDPYHKAVAEGIQALFRERGTVEPLRLHQWLRENKGADAGRAMGYMELALSPATMETCIEELHRVALLRAVHIAGRRMTQEAQKEGADVEGLVKKVGDFVDLLSSGGSSEPELLADIAGRQLKLYMAGQQPKGIQTGLKDLDDVWSGFFPGELTILAARSSMGKSALAQYFVEQVAQQTGQTVVVYSLEMGRGYLADRFLANKLGVGVDELRRGYVRKDKLAGMAVEGYQHWQHIYIDDTPNLTSFDVMTKTRRLKRKTGSLGLVVVDFLTLLGDTRGRQESRHHQVDEATRRLRAMAKDLGVPVLVLAQLNRDVEKRNDKKPTMADLRESGGIEEAADNILLLYREEYYKPLTHDKNVLEIHVAKQRQGPRGVIVRVFFDAARGIFGDLAMREVPEEWLST